MSFQKKLAVLYEITASGIFSFGTEELKGYLREYKKSGYPVVSHSERYRNTYRPAYRIVLRKYI